MGVKTQGFYANVQVVGHSLTICIVCVLPVKWEMYHVFQSLLWSRGHGNPYASG